VHGKSIFFIEVLDELELFMDKKKSVFRRKKNFRGSAVCRFFKLKDDHKLGPWAKLFRFRLCDSTKVVSVVYIFSLQLLRLKKEQHALRILQSLPPKISLICVPHSVLVDLKFIQSCGLGPLFHSPVNRCTWDSPRYRSIPDDSWGMNDLPSSCLSSRWWLSRRQST
jgi:hypothetical protein